jgi:uncharacterized protein YndB with AHSA1/START domain
MNMPNPNELRYGTFSDDATLTIQRRLPGPITRVWSYLTDSDLRAQWLASGRMDLQRNTSFELVWRNDDLSHSANERPEGFPEVSRATCLLTEIDPPRKLRFTWPDVGDVTIVLEPSGDEVLLTLRHRGCVTRSMQLMLGAGWHAHLDILVARICGLTPPSFWASWQTLRHEYDLQIAK